MGLSKETCLFSGLPILKGQEARLFILTKRFTDRVHGEKNWCPYFFPIKVLMNDYGCVEKVLDENLGVIITERISMGIKKDVLKFPERLIKWQGKEKLLEFYSAMNSADETLNALLADNILEKIIVVFAREDVYQKMLEIGKKQKEYLSHLSDTKSHSEGIVSQVQLKDLPKELKSFPKTMQNLWASEYGLDPAIFNSKLWREMSSKWVQGILEEVMFINSAMNTLRKEYTDTSIGVQQTHWREHQEFAQSIVEIVKKNSKIKAED